MRTRSVLPVPHHLDPEDLAALAEMEVILRTGRRSRSIASVTAVVPTSGLETFRAMLAEHPEQGLVLEKPEGFFQLLGVEVPIGPERIVVTQPVLEETTDVDGPAVRVVVGSKTDKIVAVYPRWFQGEDFDDHECLVCREPALVDEFSCRNCGQVAYAIEEPRLEHHDDGTYSLELPIENPQTKHDLGATEPYVCQQCGGTRFEVAFDQLCSLHRHQAEKDH